ncbi:MAG: hypothetical protein JWO95_2819, partial [Verrucomicrobiales bacterium]|nr:hypothetical protein [Verrucomicrobiales bacterium]
HGHKVFVGQAPDSNFRRCEFRGLNSGEHDEADDTGGNDRANFAEGHVHFAVVRRNEQRLDDEQRHPERHGDAVGDEHPARRWWRERPVRKGFAVQIELLKADEHQHEHEDSGAAIKIACSFRGFGRSCG